jgi:hypothetical protein
MAGWYEPSTNPRILALQRQVASLEADVAQQRKKRGGYARRKAVVFGPGFMRLPQADRQILAGTGRIRKPQ